MAQLVAFFLHPLGRLLCAGLLDGLPLVALPLLPSAPLLLASCELLELVSLPWSIQNPRAKKTPSAEGVEINLLTGGIF